MRIRIVNYELGKNEGILSKYSRKMEEGLKKLGHDVSLASDSDPKADVNHHVNYWPYRSEKSPKSVNTLMVTHVTTKEKFEALRKGMETAHGVCMSSETKEDLEKKGIKGLSVILPAHDGHSKQKIVAVLTNVYEDGCKRQWMLPELVMTIDKSQFLFLVMGTGWQSILEPLMRDGVQIEYRDKFDYEEHLKILERAHYSLYFGEDEGAMGILDSAACGLKTIAPPTGFHREIGIDYPFRTQEELNNAFKKIAENPVSKWTWEKYAKEHESLWKQLIEKRSCGSLSSHNGEDVSKEGTFVLGEKNKNRMRVRNLLYRKSQTIKAFLWKLVPEFLKEFYKKFVEKRSVRSVEKFLRKKYGGRL